MNKYQEALDYVKKHLDSKQDIEKVEVLQELVNKGTPKKPILSDTWKDEEQTDIYDENGFIDPIVSICPNCRKYGIFDFEYGEKFNYCKHCGQAIDWSDE